MPRARCPMRDRHLEFTNVADGGNRRSLAERPRDRHVDGPRMHLHGRAVAREDLRARHQDPVKCTEHSAERTKHSAERTKHSAERTKHPAECTKHSAECTKHSAECTKHSAECTKH